MFTIATDGRVTTTGDILLDGRVIVGSYHMLGYRDKTFMGLSISANGQAYLDLGSAATGYDAVSAAVTSITFTGGTPVLGGVMPYSGGIYTRLVNPNSSACSVTSVTVRVYFVASGALAAL